MRYIFAFIIVSIGINVNAGVPTLVLPDDSLVTIGHEVQFLWDETPNADYYQLEISNHYDFSTSTVFSIISTDTSINLSLGNYYWRIQSFENSIASAYSNDRYFSIIDINNLSSNSIAWYNSDSTFLYDANNKVLEWKDISGENNHATQLTSSYRPSINNSSQKLNDKKTILFNGGTFINTPDLNLQDTEVFIIAKGNNELNKILGFGLGFWVNQSHRGPLIYLTLDNWKYFGPYQDVGIYQIQNFGFKNGAASANTSFISMNKEVLIPGQNSINSGFQLDNLFIGGTASAPRLNGEIAEIIVFNDYLTSEERDQVSNYLRHKYAPPVNLGAKVYKYGFCNTILYAGKRFESYLWSDGSTTDSLVVSESGTYWVEVEDVFGFISRDTVEVISDFQYPNSQQYCLNDTIIWHTNLGTNYSYLWSDFSTADTIFVDTPGNFHVTVSDTNGCIFKSDTLTFAEDPFSTTTTLGADTTMCSGNNLGLTIGANDAVDYLWSTGETTPEIVINTTGTYDVIVQNANGCEVKDTIDVTIMGDAPIIQTQLPSTVCVDAPFDFEDLSTTTDGSTIIGWDWDFGDGATSILNQGNHAYSISGTYDIDLVIESSSGCFNNQTATIEVKDNPILTFATSNQCQDESIQFNGGQLSPQSITIWKWNFDDPASGIDNIGNGQNTAHIYDTPGDYEIMLIGTDAFGCADTLVQTKTIAPAPVANFTFSEVCEGAIVNYKNTSTVTPPAAISANQWSFGDGTNSNQNNPQKPYSLHGTYVVELITTANNGCSHSTNKNIKIHGTPQVQHTIAQDCAGLETSFTDASFVPDGSVAEINWTFNNQTPINGFSITNNFTSSGVYSLEQTVKSGFGCINVKNSDITINSYLNADFVFTPSAFIADYPIVFESTSTGANEYLWTFGNFATSQQADTTIVFDESQIGTELEVQLKVKNQWNCTDSSSVKNTVMEQRTDLELSQLFSQEINGFLTIGVRLKNKGSTPITEVDLVLRSPSTGFIKETWSGLLQADEEEIYIFSASPSAKITAEDTLQNFLCIEGSIVQPAQFTEEDFSNNEVCKTMTDNQTVIVFPYPNPVKEELTVKVVMPKKGVVALSVYDNHGRLVHVITEKQELEKGLNVFVVETGTWTSGRYNIVFEGDGKVPTVGFIKL